MADSETKPRGRSKNSSKQKISIQSPYSKPVLKTRSVSNSKSTNSIKNSTLLTSSSKNLFQDLFSVNFEKKHMGKSSMSDLRIDLTSEDLYARLSKDLKHAKTIEDEFEVYQRYFIELIKADKKYGKVLLKIKSAYDSRINSSDSNLLLKLKTELKELQGQANKDYRDKQLYTKKIEKLAKENVELSRALDDAEEKYNSMILRLQEITNYDLQKIPKDEITWKALAMENQALCKINKEMQQDLKLISSKEKKLISLLLELKRLGYPVEEIYEQKQAKSKREESPGSYVEDTDNEALVSGRAKVVAKPNCIPNLKLRDLQAEINSSFSSEF
jgi:hypothetical protein